MKTLKSIFKILNGREIGQWPKWIETNLKLRLPHSNVYILHIFDNDLSKNHTCEICLIEANILLLSLFYVDI